MRRREFITLVGGTAAAWPILARAQKAPPVVGYLHASSEGANRHQVLAFEKGLVQTGYVRGQNVTIEYRWAEGRYDQLARMAGELVEQQVAVIATGTPVASLAAKKATTSIPIVFVVGGDPVANRLVASLNRPGGNITGAMFFSNLLTGKRFALLHEFVPRAKLFAALVNPKNANARMQMADAQTTAREMGVQLITANAENVGDIDNVFEEFKTEKIDALLVLSDAFLNSHAGQIAAYALRYGIPTCFAYREPAVAGGLMSYGVSVTGAATQAGNYTGRILKGEKPGDLPVQQPTKFDFVLNMKTAKALGLTVPDKIIALADEVIE
jgi:putative ABC transport system substrate-binding protein